MSSQCSKYQDPLRAIGLVAQLGTPRRSIIRHHIHHHIHHHLSTVSFPNVCFSGSVPECSMIPGTFGLPVSPCRDDTFTCGISLWRAHVLVYQIVSNTHLYYILSVMKRRLLLFQYFIHVNITAVLIQMDMNRRVVLPCFHHYDHVTYSARYARFSNEWVLSSLVIWT